jgi:hypothetical protein
LCYVKDDKSKKEHSQMGMIGSIIVEWYVIEKIKKQSIKDFHHFLHESSF